MAIRSDIAGSPPSVVDEAEVRYDCSACCTIDHAVAMRLYSVLANSVVCLSRMSCGVAITGACAMLAVNGVHGSSPKIVSYGERLLIRFGDVRYANMAIWMTWPQ